MAVAFSAVTFESLPERSCPTPCACASFFIRFFLRDSLNCNEVVRRRQKTPVEPAHPRPRRVTDLHHDAVIANEVRRAGAAIAFLLAAFSAVDDLRNRKLVRVRPQLHTYGRSVYAVYPSRQFVDARIKRFIDVLKTHVGEPLGCNAMPTLPSTVPHSHAPYKASLRAAISIVRSRS